MPIINASVFPRLLALMTLGALSMIYGPAESVTPSNSASEKTGSIQHVFDLQFNSGGEISGWITVTTEGRIAAVWRDWLTYKTSRELCGKLNGYLLGFFPNARVIDAVTEGASANAASLVVKAYIIIPAGGSSVSSIQFPFSNDILPDIGNESRREGDFPIKLNTVGVSFSLRLPHGSPAPVLPGPFQEKTPAVTMEAHWNCEGDVLRGDASYTILKSPVPAGEFGDFFQAVQRFSEWLKAPVAFDGEGGIKFAAASKTAPKKGSKGSKVDSKDARSSGPRNSPRKAAGKTTGDAAGNATDATLDFPRMFSGEGQLALANIRYPAKLDAGVGVVFTVPPQNSHVLPTRTRNDVALARAAMEKTIEYFPDDKNTVFTASVYLVLLGSIRGREQQTREKLTQLLASHKDSVDADTLAWGKLMLADQLDKISQALSGAGKMSDRDRARAAQPGAAFMSSIDDEQLAILDEIATDARVSARLRQGAAWNAWAMADERRQQGKAVPMFTKITDLATGRDPTVCCMMAQLCIDAGEMATLRKQIETLLQTRPADGLEILGAMVNSSTMWPEYADEAKLARISAFADMVKELVPIPSPSLQSTLDKLRARIAARTQELESKKAPFIIPNAFRTQ